ncbi:MAG: hypothetical protein ABS41_05275 [Arenimonas sp. SCN 70-307]|uniref:DUF2062 domain-containing protein n=2 Tax=unclassified Arenimonas TaxID=2641713 RepID=UPI00086CBC40|nr:DUF2062 domain-containing protein [Arenimonas sp. SCN 70-307]ODS63583.1 MAG: hypothetical protein ABS41_05275 [Arenimonas sp. SCN 70-307]
MPVRSHPLHRSWLARRRRLRRWLRPLPRRANVARYPVIKWFAEAARKRPYLWSLKRQHVLVSLYSGAVLALMPVYGVQLAIGLALAVWLRGNLTVMAALQMVTNPLTLGPIYYATHKLGSWLIGLVGYGEGASAVGTHINALVVGGIVGGLGFALLLDLGWRLLAWEARRFRSQLAALHEHFGYRHGDGDAPGD